MLVQLLSLFLATSACIALGTVLASGMSNEEYHALVVLANAVAVPLGPILGVVIVAFSLGIRTVIRWFRK